MERPVLYISPKKYTRESAVISCRIPKDMLDEIDRLAASTGRARNEVIGLCLEFALEHLAERGETARE